ncbi:MAG: glutamate--cysteine ligase [Kofleriaceae bacterium]
MGIEILRTDFDDRDHVRFAERLRTSLVALEHLLARDQFGVGPATIGAELELALIDGAARPALVNTAVLGESSDPRLALEIDRFNLEINAEPSPLAGRPFAALAANLESALAEVRRAAANHGARALAIGILPTIVETDLTPDVITPRNRYIALSHALRRLRRGPFHMHIEGADVLDVSADDVVFEGANTSFQLHLRTSPAEFARAYNASQIASGIALAVAGNAPTFLGRRLWDETRIALFRQSVDDRLDALDDDWRPARVTFGHGWARHSAHELFAEVVALHEALLPICTEEDPIHALADGGVPSLAELRLHNGTVWPWNRGIFDPVGGGHLRIELRALPAGPSVVDMAANAAFLLGLVLGLAPDVDRLIAGFTFTHARRNFYEAARRGLASTLLWPAEPGRRAEPILAPALIDRLLPVAARGLRDHGVDSRDSDHLLGVIADRARTGQTGAAFQRALLATSRDPARVVEEYLARQLDGAPVHTWSQT